MPPEPDEQAKSDQHLANGEKDDRTLPSLCAELHARVSAFLAEEAPNDRLKKVQEQTRISMSVIAEALNRYRCASSSIRPLQQTPRPTTDKVSSKLDRIYSADKPNQFQLPRTLPLLQRRQRLPRPPHPLPRHPPHTHYPTTAPTPPIRLHRLAAPLSRSRIIRRRLLPRLPPRPGALRQADESRVRRVPAGKAGGEGDLCRHAADRSARGRVDVLRSYGSRLAGVHEGASGY